MYTLSHKNKNNKIIVVSKIAGPTKIDAGELNLLACFGDRRIVTPAEIGRKKLVYELTGVVPLSRFFCHVRDRGNLLPHHHGFCAGHGDA